MRSDSSFWSCSTLKFGTHRTLFSLYDGYLNCSSYAKLVIKYYNVNINPHLLIIHSSFLWTEVKPSVAADLPLNAEQIANETEIRDKEETLPVKRKKASKEEERRKKKKAMKENEGSKEASKENNGSKKKVLKENEGSKKLKSKKSKRSTCEIHDESWFRFITWACLCVQSKVLESNVDVHYD